MLPFFISCFLPIEPNFKVINKAKRKQKEFMRFYECIHENFVRFCKARAYGVMSHEDLVSESVLKAYQSWERIEKKEALLYYLFTTARHIVLNTQRKKSEESMGEREENTLTVGNTAEIDMEIEFLYGQMSKLSDQKKEAIILFEINGFSMKEIAEIQGASVGSVKVMISRARKELKVLLENESDYNALNENYSEKV